MRAVSGQINCVDYLTGSPSLKEIKKETLKRGTPLTNPRCLHCYHSIVIFCVTLFQKQEQLCMLRLTLPKVYAGKVCPAFLSHKTHTHTWPSLRTRFTGSLVIPYSWHAHATLNLIHQKCLLSVLRCPTEFQQFIT